MNDLDLKEILATIIGSTASVERKVFLVTRLIKQHRETPLMLSALKAMGDLRDSSDSSKGAK